MIHWKVSVLTVALGAAATAGFVWLGRKSRKGAPELVRSLGTAGAARLGVEQEFDAEQQEFDAEQAARADAIHDFKLSEKQADRQGREEIVALMEEIEADALDIDPVGVEPTEIEMSELGVEALSDGERYDAVDPDRLGNEFLSRAIEAPPVSPPMAMPFAPPPPDEAYPTATQRPEEEVPPNEDELERRRTAEATRNE